MYVILKPLYFMSCPVRSQMHLREYLNYSPHDVQYYFIARWHIKTSMVDTK